MKAENDIEIIGLKVDLLDRLEGYIIKPSELYVYEDEIRSLAKMPPQRKKSQFNKLVNKIRSNCKKKIRQTR